MILHIIPDLETHRVRFWRTDLTSLVHRHPDAFARLVRRQREALGLSYRAAADRCGYSTHATLFDIEHMAYSQYTASTIRAVMDGLALTVDDLRAEIAAMDDMREAA